MAIIANEVLTYADLAKRQDPNGKIARIIELMIEYNEILEDMLWMQCNNKTSHLTTVRTGIPEPAWRLLNYGVPKGKSRTAQVTDTCGMLEAFIEVDKKLADLSGDPNGFRLSEVKAYMQGFNNVLARTIFYGSTQVNPDRFNGLAMRYATGVLANAQSAENVINGGGEGSDNTSIYLLVWGDQTMHGIYPENLPAGLSHTNMGEDVVKDADGNQYKAYRDHLEMNVGMTVRDWQYGVRIANIDVSNIGSDTTAMKALINLMIDAEERIPILGVGKAAWYGNRQIRTALRKGILEKVANNLTEERVAGKRVTMFDGIPFRRCDAILNTEALVPFV